MAQFLTSLLGNGNFTLRDTFGEERKAIFQKLIQKEFDEHCQIYADLFDRTKQAVEALSREGLEIPFEIRVAAEVTLSDRLFEEMKELKDRFEEEATFYKREMGITAPVEILVGKSEEIKNIIILIQICFLLKICST
jgi:hypothetical protein